ncbi:hypothetical protein GCM10022291_26890 [Postechiella marina]|uniref:Uncharacterized protein n=1 Tax=Postechiella marina TaxID=943941 RepID=A0ABP8CDW1_9FLAO
MVSLKDIDCVMVNGECIPRYVFPPTNAQEGEKYYHAKLGVITFKTGNWVNIKGVIITTTDLLIE